MLGRLAHSQLLRYAGLFTWAMVGIPLVFDSWLNYFPDGEALEPLPGRPDLRIATLAYLAFGALYWMATHGLGVRRPRWTDILLLVALTASAIAFSHFSGTGLAGILLMIIAGVIPWLVPVSWGVAWLVVQHVALVPVFTAIDGFTPVTALLQAALYIGFSSFTFITALVARQQAQARDEQRRLNAELRATRALLAESSRVTERMRISRELHDLLGHHLTALSLNLEVASHLSEGRAQEHVRQAQSLAKLLLADVREAVSQLRGDDTLDLSEALRSLCDGVPGLDVQLTLPDRFAIDDPQRAHVLLRCAQELITNVVRHASADVLAREIRSSGDGLTMVARDNGGGAEPGGEGNGLRGKRERLAQFGGSLTIHTRPGQGFQATVELPVGRDAPKPVVPPAAAAPTATETSA